MATASGRYNQRLNTDERPQSAGFADLLLALAG